MKTYDAVIVFGIEPRRNPETGEWRLPDSVYECLDKASILLNDGTAHHIIVSGNRAVRQRYIKGDWHPQAECDMAADYLIGQRGIAPDKILRESESEDTAANYLYVTRRIVLPKRMKHILVVTLPAQEERARFFGNLIVAPYCAFEVITTNQVATPEEIASQHLALTIQRYGFRDIQPGDLDALERRFYDGEPYQHFKYLDLAKAYEETRQAQALT